MSLHAGHGHQAVAGSRAGLGQQDVESLRWVTSPRRRDDEGSSVAHARDPAEREQALGERGAGNTANEYCPLSSTVARQFGMRHRRR
jgi:hypothetical protein